MAVEDHGAGTQFVRLRSWPRLARLGWVPPLGLAVLAIAAAVGHSWVASAILGFAAAALTLRALAECGVATAALQAGTESA
jgi:hypothetical protein